MDKQKVKQRVGKLKKVIQHHRYLYHVLDKQEISDQALDSLKKELFDLEQKYPELVTADSPTQRVGGKPLDKFKKTKHRKRMLSFDDAFVKQDMQDWQDRIKKLATGKLDYFAEPKIDGLAVSLVYKKGVLQRGATRGDGRIGEDVTRNLRTIETIPLRLEKPVDCEARGEVFISKKNFKKFQKKYANPRNLAAGSIRQLDSKIAASRKLSFLAWQISGQLNQVEEYKQLKALGFKAVPGKFCKDLEAVFDYHQKMLEQRDKLPYQIDGIVVSVNNNKTFEKLGIVGKAPRGSIAYKFPLKQATTIIEDIIVQVGRTGALTPVAVLKPVEIAGVTISRATLHNEDEIKRLGARIGDTAIVGRAGDVIPSVVKVLPELRTGREKKFIFPKICPVCKSKAKKQDGEVVWRCSNAKCMARKRKQFHHFVSKQAFDIVGLGPQIVDQLLNEGLISDPADLFLLKQGDLAPLDRFAEKSAENLVKSAAERKKISFSRFIFALGISNIGEQTAIDLAEHFNSLSKLKKASLSELEGISDIGPVSSKAIFEWLRDADNVKFLEKLKKAGVEISLKFKVKSEKLKGKIFVFTGALEEISRDEAKEKVRILGGEVSESVSKNTNYVVAGKEPGSKLAKAKKIGIKVIGEKEFIEMLFELEV